MLKHLAAGVRSRLCSIQLGSTFECEAIKKKIWLIDHIYNLWRRAGAEFETPLVRNYASAIVWHGYAGEPDWVERVQKMYPDVGMNWTEGGPDYTDPNHAKDWANWSRRFMGILRKCCRSTAWNLALDEHGRPNLRPFTCGGLVTVNSQGKNISPSRQFTPSPTIPDSYDVGPTASTHRAHLTISVIAPSRIQTGSVFSWPRILAPAEPVTFRWKVNLRAFP